MLVRPWGVYEPQGDSLLLREALLKSAVPSGARALDVCSGTGLIALTAARLGARPVRAIDTSYRAVLTARCNARLNRLRIRVEHGDFRHRLGGHRPPGHRFDLVTANPPYVPTPGTDDPKGAARAWNAGPDGRLYLDRLCAMAPQLLHPGGTMLVVHSALCDPDRTLHLLVRAGLKASVVARRRQPFGPVLTARADWLTDRGLIRRGQTEEELVVVRADRATSPPRVPHGPGAGTAASTP